MKSFIKRVFSFFLLLCILVVPVHANQTENSEEVIIVQPRFTYINVFQNLLEVSSSGKASVTVYLNASNVDSVRVVAYLQQYKDGRWITIKSWSETRDGVSSGLGKNYYVASGYSYRLKSYGYVYINVNLVETTNYTSESKVY